MTRNLKPYKRRRVRAMPIEPLLDNPACLRLPAAGFGMLMRLALHYWQTDCHDLPAGDHELQSIARAQRPTWISHRVEIMSIFDAWSGYAKDELELAIARRGNILRLGMRGHSVQKLKALHNNRALDYAQSIAPLDLAASPKRAATSQPPIRHAGPNQTPAEPQKPRRLTERGNW